MLSLNSVGETAILETLSKRHLSDRFTTPLYRPLISSWSGVVYFFPFFFLRPRKSWDDVEDLTKLKIIIKSKLVLGGHVVGWEGAWDGDDDDSEGMKRIGGVTGGVSFVSDGLLSRRRERRTEWWPGEGRRSDDRPTPNYRVSVSARRLRPIDSLPIIAKQRHHKGQSSTPRISSPFSFPQNKNKVSDPTTG